MSHINDALKKAQKEKDTLYQRYRQMLPGQQSDDSEQRKADWKRPAVFAAVCAIAAVALGVYLVSDRTVTKEIASGDTAAQHTSVQERQQPAATVTTSSAAHNRAHPPRPAPSTVRSETPPPGPPSTTSAVRAPATASTEVPPFESLVNAQLSRQDTPSAPKTPPASKPADLQQLYDRALAYQRHNNLPGAERLYVKILKTDPKFVTAMNNLGVIYMSQDRLAKASQMFKKALFIKKDYVDPYYNLACVHSLSGNMAESLTYLKKAIDLKKDVKNWANNDKDLSRLHNFIEFRELMGGPVKVSGEKGDLYTVKKGEWIFDIIRTHYAVSDKDAHIILNEIKTLNKSLADSNIIYPGQKILLPPREDIEKTIQFNTDRDTQ